MSCLLRGCHELYTGLPRMHFEKALPYSHIFVVQQGHDDVGYSNWHQRLCIMHTCMYHRMSCRAQLKLKL